MKHLLLIIVAGLVPLLVGCTADPMPRHRFDGAQSDVSGPHNVARIGEDTYELSTTGLPDYAIVDKDGVVHFGNSPNSVLGLTPSGLFVANPADASVTGLEVTYGDPVFLERVMDDGTVETRIVHPMTSLTVGGYTSTNSVVLAEETKRQAVLVAWFETATEAQRDALIAQAEIVGGAFETFVKEAAGIAGIALPTP